MARGRKFGKDGLSSTFPNKMSNCALKVLKLKLLLLMAFGRELNSLGALTAKERSTAVFILPVALAFIGGNTQLSPLRSL